MFIDLGPTLKAKINHFWTKDCTSTSGIIDCHVLTDIVRLSLTTSRCSSKKNGGTSFTTTGGGEQGLQNRWIMINGKVKQMN